MSKREDNSAKNSTKERSLLVDVTAEVVISHRQSGTVKICRFWAFQWASNCSPIFNGDRVTEIINRPNLYNCIEGALM